MARFQTRNRRMAIGALLVVAFGLSAWKVHHRPNSGEFAFAPFVAQQTSISASAPPDRPAGSNPQPSPDGQLTLGESFVSTAAGQAVHAASLVELTGGRLRAVWFSGSREGAADVVIKTAVSGPGGESWSAESTLFGRLDAQRGLMRYVKKLGNPVIARAPDGSLYLWVVTVSLGGWAGSSVTWLRSADEGNTWGEPHRLVTSPFINISTLVKGGPFFYADGQMGLPVYHEFATKFAEVLRLDRHGQLVDKVRIPGSRTELQPVVLVTGPTDADVFMRSGQAVALMSSGTRDAGKNWTRTRATAWPNPDAAVAGVVDGAGSEWLAMNPSLKNRQSLSLLKILRGTQADSATAIRVESAGTDVRLPVPAYEKLLGAELKARGGSESETAADIASAKRQLCGSDECSQEFSYPFLLRSSDGYIHLVYTWHRTRIKHVRFDPRLPLLAGTGKK